MYIQNDKYIIILNIKYSSYVFYFTFDQDHWATLGVIFFSLIDWLLFLGDKIYGGIYICTPSLNILT